MIAELALAIANVLRHNSPIACALAGKKAQATSAGYAGWGGFAVRKEKLELLQGTLDMLVLKTLTDGPLHGYNIVSRIQQLSSDVIRVEEGSLYPALHRMERRGWIVSDWGYSENNRRAKYYKMTRAGRRQLDSEVFTWGRISHAIASVLGGPAAALG